MIHLDSRDGEKEQIIELINTAIDNKDSDESNDTEEHRLNESHSLAQFETRFAKNKQSSC